jgi:predicted transcriptional regulator
MSKVQILAVYSLEKRSAVVANRTRVEILASILNVAERGTLKTHIMYRANLSHRQLEKYLTFLDGNGMLRQVVDEDSGSRLYQITEKGIDFLKDYSRLSSTYGQDILRK